MPFTVPNTPDAGFAPQAGLDSRDLDVLAASPALTGVVSGCAVTAQGSPDMTVAVAAGVVRIGGRRVTVTGGNVTITTADGTNPRHDLITVDTSGTKAVVTGTPAAVTATTEPVFAAIPAGRVVLAAVYVPASDTTIAANQITDKRVLVDNPPHENVRWYGATGDGVTNDQPGIQAAIDAAGRGGTVILPRGIYIVADDGTGRDAVLEVPSPFRMLGLAGTGPFAAGGGGICSIQLPAGQHKYILTHDGLSGPDYWAHGLIVEGIQFKGCPSLRWPAAGTTTTATTGGTLAAGTYSYRVTALTAVGETRPSLEHTIATTGSTSTVTLNWTAPPSDDDRAAPAVTGYKVYGRTRGNWLLMATLGVVLTWTDTGSVTPSGAMNLRNTSGQQVGGGLKCCLGENAILRDLAFFGFPEAGLAFRRDYVTQLNGALTASQTNVTVDGTGIVNGDVIQVQHERMTVTAGGGTTALTVTRGVWGTTATTHPDNQTVYQQRVCNSAPAYLENICTYRNFAGVHWDHAYGQHAIFGWTGDDDNYQMFVSNNSTDPNDGGTFLNIHIVGVKAEVSTDGGHVAHNPWMLINNGNECQVEVDGAHIDDWGVPQAQRRLFPKDLVKITSGHNGFASTYSANVTWRNVGLENYRNLFVDTVKGEVQGWYDSNWPIFKHIASVSHRGVIYVRSEASESAIGMQIQAPATPFIRMTQKASASLTANVLAADTVVNVNTKTNFPTVFPFNIRLNGEVIRADSSAGALAYNVTRNQTGSESGAEFHTSGTWLYYEGDAYVTSGQNAPEGAVTAPSGSIYLRQLGAVTDPSAYIKDTGSGNTGWRVLNSDLVVPYSKAGTLSTGAGTLRFYLDGAYELVSVRASVGTAPTGASLIVDVNKNGTTIFGTQANRPTIAVSTNTAVAGAASVTSFAAGDYVSVDVDQVGSTVAGSDLVVSVILRRK